MFYWQLTAEARCKLVSWIIPVHKHLRLSFECCCLAVNIMDRFLASTAVAADCFQLLGVTALLLASKQVSLWVCYCMLDQIVSLDITQCNHSNSLCHQVEVCSPRISHLLSLCCDAFTKEQLCNLECLVLLRLNFCLAAPTLAFFLDYYTNCIEAADKFARMNTDPKIPRQWSSLAQKVCELSLADYAFNKYPPSLTASCALRLVSELLKTEQGLIDYVVTWWDSSVSEHNHSLAQECKDNLKLLVSLNQETLEVMFTM